MLLRLGVLGALLAALQLPAMAASIQSARPAMSFIYNSNQSSLEGVDRYVWQVLDMSLQRTREQYGDYWTAAVPMVPTARRAYDLEHGVDGITVGLFTDNPEHAEHLIPVRVPVDRGLSGYRLLLIHASDQPRFSDIETLAGLRKIRFGLLSWWDDVAILRQSGLPAEAGSSYKGLFQMLKARRFDALSRSAREVLPECEQMKNAIPDLAIENHLLLHYDLPVYFWFRDDAEGRRRAERVRSGLEQMVADGTLKTMFDAEFGPTLAKLDLAHRVVIELPNPLLGGTPVPKNPALWYRP